jgi:hypothetical protein
VRSSSLSHSAKLSRYELRFLSHHFDKTVDIRDRRSKVELFGGLVGRLPPLPSHATFPAREPETIRNVIDLGA